MAFYVEEYRSRGQTLKRIYADHDGCKDQFKSRKNLRYISIFCSKFPDIELFISTTAPPDCFKCIVDSMGGVLNKELRTGERDDRFRCTNALQFYRAMRANVIVEEKMSDEERSRWSIDRFFHYYVTDKANEGSFEEQPGDKIVWTNCATETDATKVAGINSQFIFRGMQGEDGHCYMRERPCACRACDNRQWDQCIYTDFIGPWKKVKSEAVPIVKGAVSVEEWLKQFYSDFAVTEDKPIIVAVLRERGESIEPATVQNTLQFFVLCGLPAPFKGKDVPVNPAFPNIQQFAVKVDDMCISVCALESLDDSAYIYMPVDFKLYVPIDCVVPPDDEHKNPWQFLDVTYRKTFVFQTPDATSSTKRQTYTLKKDHVDALFDHLS